MTNECVQCGVGTFQDAHGSLSCKECPAGTNTTGEGAKNASQCLKYCAPGSFSKTGLVPCQLCPSSSYQPEANQNSCIKCEAGRRTREEGSVSPDKCKPYDISVTQSKKAVFVMDRAATNMTLFAWIFLQDIERKESVFSLSTPNDTFYIDLIFNSSVVLDINGNNTTFAATLPNQEWIPFALTINTFTNEANVCVNELLVATEKINMARSEVIQKGDIFQLQSGVILSSFMIMDSILQVPDIARLSTSCTATDTRSIYNMDDIVAPEAARVITPSICDAVNECKSSPCGNHTCINKLAGYECVCHGGFSGQKCEIPPDFCIGNSCSNGASCINDVDGYSCKCTYGFKGALCEKKAADGGWSLWSKWSSCSRTCGGGYSSRERQCNNPSPDPEGQPCDGVANETISCNDNKCPECPRLLRSYGVLINCNETEFSKRCEISCRAGLFFATEPLPFYECGFITNYTWNHQTKENPTSRLPACTEIKPPSQMSVSFQGHYESVECTSENVQTIKNEITASLGNIECVQHGTCNASVSHGTCGRKERRKRSNGGIKVSVELNSEVVTDGPGYSIEDLLTNKSTPSSDLINFLKQAAQMEMAAQTIFNKSTDFFEVTINHVKHTIANGSVQFSSSLACPPGSIPVEIFCAECPIGCFSDGKSVIMCPMGQYQDEKGQSNCKQCPKGYTTAGVGSIDITECSEVLHLTETAPYESNGVHIAVGVAVSVSVLIIAVSVAGFVYRYKGKGQRKVNESYEDLAMRNVYSVEKPVFDRKALHDQEKINM